jgi:hypothetical protein
MKRSGANAALSMCLVAGLLTSAIAEGPTKENLTGKWVYTSYLLDPGSRQAGPPATSTAMIWATADVELTEKVGENGNSTISGTLAFKGLPFPLTLEVKGRRVKRGGTDRFMLSGNGERPPLPGEPQGSKVRMENEIRGAFSAPYPPNSSKLSVRGYVRNTKGDPRLPEGIGAFVLIPAENTAAAPAEAE